MKKKTNKKLRVALIMTMAAVIVLTVGAFALFSDSLNASANAKNGTVVLSLGELTIGNSENVNPGDGDCSNPDDARPGTEHPLKFKVGNMGNKSIVTRNRLVISVKDKYGNVLDASPYFLYERNTTTGVRIDLSSYRKEIVENGKVIAVEYLIPAKSFNGRGTGAEIETEAGMVASGEEWEYTYYLGLSRTVDNEYQSALVTVDLFVEAMQYRNTNNNDWSYISTKQISAGGTTVSVVPAEGEDASGNNIW